MGLFKATKNAIGTTLSDQWLDAISCEDMGNTVLMLKKTTPNGIISRKSRIVVNPGQLALIVDNGNILDGTAEPGAFIFDGSSSPSFFGGDFGAVFKEMGERFKYHGAPAREQAVYFFNTKEIMGNKFGTPAPVPYKDWGHPNFNPRNNQLYPMALNIKAFGSFTFKIENPFLFMNQVAGTAVRYTKEDLQEQIRSEFVAAFKNTLAELGGDQFKVEAMDLPHKDDEVIAAMQGKDYDARIRERGVKILAVAVESIKFDAESDKKIRDYELSDAYTQSGYLAGATGRAMESAAQNKAGAMTGFMGMGMAQNAGVNQQTLGQMMANQNTAAQNAAPAQQAEPLAKEASWVCANCGETKNTGRFCLECGKAKSEAPSGWNCQCGAMDNTGKFCSQCGKPRPQKSVSYQCNGCGWVPQDQSNPPKFCPECGDIFDDKDIVS